MLTGAAIIGAVSLGSNPGTGRPITHRVIHRPSAMDGAGKTIARRQQLSAARRAAEKLEDPNDDSKNQEYLHRRLEEPLKNLQNLLTPDLPYD